MQRYKVSVAYLGTRFHGWQNNKHDPLSTVQGYIQHLIQPLMPCLPIPLVGSGRTDAGVHATNQVFHVDILRVAKRRMNAKDKSATIGGNGESCGRSGEEIRLHYESDISWNCIPRFKGLNVPGSGPRARLVDLYRIAEPIEPGKLLGLLNARAMQENAPIHFNSAEMVSTAFHARFSAYSRAYQYRIVFHGRNHVFEQDRAWCLPESSSAFRLEDAKCAASALLGRHDFTSFRAAACQAKSPIRTIDSIKFEWTYDFVEGLKLLDSTKPKDLECTASAPTTSSNSNKMPNSLVITVRAPSFLHSQVRNIVGCLVDVGLGKLDPREVPIILERRSRADNPCLTAPPQGLYLTEILYPPSEEGQRSSANTEANEDQGSLSGPDPKTTLESSAKRRWSGQYRYFTDFVKKNAPAAQPPMYYRDDE